MDDEVWKSVPGIMGYEVSSAGRVKSKLRRVNGNPRNKVRTQREAIMKSRLGPMGHPRITLRVSGKSKSFYVHRLVMLAFSGPCPAGMEVCHNNGVPTDNRVANLRYDTKSANMLDQRRHGVLRQGEKHGCAKLTEWSVRVVMRLKGRLPTTQIGPIFGVHPSTIQLIHAKKRWRHLAAAREVICQKEDNQC